MPDSDHRITVRGSARTARSISRVIVAATMLATAVPAISAPGRNVFMCLTGTRRIEIDRSDGVLTYRSFKPAGLELQIGDGRHARTSYSGGGELQVSFSNGPWTYVTYERVVRTGFTDTNDPDFQAGVDVVKSGRTVTRLKCRDQSTQFAENAFAGLDEGEFVEH